MVFQLPCCQQCWYCCCHLPHWFIFMSAIIFSTNTCCMHTSFECWVKKGWGIWSNRNCFVHWTAVSAGSPLPFPSLPILSWLLLFYLTDLQVNGPGRWQCQSKHCIIPSLGCYCYWLDDNSIVWTGTCSCLLSHLHQQLLRVDWISFVGVLLLLPLLTTWLW